MTLSHQDVSSLAADLVTAEEKSLKTVIVGIDDFRELIELAKHAMTRPAVHRARLSEVGWDLAHPITCDPLNCDFVKRVAAEAEDKAAVLLGWDQEHVFCDVTEQDGQLVWTLVE